MSHDAVGPRSNGGRGSRALSGGGIVTPLSATTRGGLTPCVAPREPSSSITLSVPRPEHQRANNVYVETPFPHRIPARRPPAPLPGPPDTHPLASVHGGGAGRSRHQPVAHKPASSTDSGTLQKKKWPPPSSSSKPPSSLVSAITFAKTEAPSEDSIICSRCGRCKCGACATPAQPMGGVWLCGGKFHCSPKTAVDHLSCLCCVRGAFYHCGGSHGDAAGTAAVDRPCSCVGPNALLRWACLAAACVPLPCLLCYWPLEGVRRFFEGTYSRFRSNGCRCDDRSPKIPVRLQPSAQAPPEKRLLQDCA